MVLFITLKDASIYIHIRQFIFKKTYSIDIGKNSLMGFNESIPKLDCRVRLGVILGINKYM